MKLGILSDAHGHIGAFDIARAVLHDAGAQTLFFLGDAVGYIPDPAVAERIRTLGMPAIKGNHEVMMFSSDVPPEREAAYQHKATLARMGEATRDFVRDLPASSTITLGGVRCLMVHGSPADPNRGYVYPDTDLRPFSGVDADVVFMGHTHRPFVRREQGVLFVNVGSCALPRDDDSRGAACVFDTDRRQANIIRFDISVASRDALARYRLHDTAIAALRRSASAGEDV